MNYALICCIFFSTTYGMESNPNKQRCEKYEDLSLLMGSTSKTIEKRRSLQIPDSNIQPRVIVPSTSDDYNEVVRATSLQGLFRKYKAETQELNHNESVS